jgi:hypothetical protein
MFYALKNLKRAGDYSFFRSQKLSEYFDYEGDNLRSSKDEN